MKITKLGHCALLIDLKGKRILTDPGAFTVEAQSEVRDIDYVLYTHEHQDHFHLESLKEILKNNPNIEIFANASVGDLLEKENLPYTLVEHKQVVTLGEITIEGIGEKHAEIHSSIPLSDNIGFFVDKRLWYPGDAFTPIEKEVEILALPIAGPWMKVSDAINYAVSVNPKNSFPVHDGMLNEFGQFLPQMIERILKTQNIEFTPLGSGESVEFY
jgi:L-ascorbate metabolism protein UlaG (beta-lactamase superfamily)